MKMRTLLSISLGILIGISSWQLIQGHTTQVQSWVAKSLLHTAWVRAKSSGDYVKPWPWSDTWPLARLSIPHLQLEEIVLAHTNKNISNFALFHLNSSVFPGELGNTVLSAHRESYFQFINSLKPGDLLVLESLRSGRWRYQVSAIYVVDKTNTQLLKPSLNRRITLVTCYSCQEKEANLRYVVIADEVERINSTTAHSSMLF